jgi:hypothetical protein
MRTLHELNDEAAYLKVEWEGGNRVLCASRAMLHECLKVKFGSDDLKDRPVISNISTRNLTDLD